MVVMRATALFLLGVMSAGGAALAGEVQVPKAYAKNLAQSPSQQVCRAAASLMAAQREDGWAWRRGDKATAQNVSGIVAVALAKSADQCATTSSVTRFAESLKARHQAGEFLFDPDIEALAAAAALTGNPEYRELAREAFQRRYEFASGEEIVERWFMLKRDPRLIGFDAASAIRAALAAGEREKAVEIAAAAVRNGGRWAEGWDRRGFLTSSRGAMLEALTMIGSRRFAAFQRDLVHHLVLTQSRDGSWDGRNTQATAYAIRGLRASQDESAVGSVELGSRWLRMTQLQDGAWASFNDYLPEPFVGEVVHEVTAEVALALR